MVADIEFINTLKNNNMKVKIKVEKEFEINKLSVKAGVEYWEDAEVHGVKEGQDIPCRVFDSWCPEINIENGKILNWVEGVRAKVHFKVCDCCGWALLDESGSVVISEEDGYVPATLCPEGGGYGDYIIMNIGENGQIANWRFDISDFVNEEY